MRNENIQSINQHDAVIANNVVSSNANHELRKTILNFLKVLIKQQNEIDKLNKQLLEKNQQIQMLESENLSLQTLKSENLSLQNVSNEVVEMVEQEDENESELSDEVGYFSNDNYYHTYEYSQENESSLSDEVEFSTQNNASSLGDEFESFLSNTHHSTLKSFAKGDKFNAALVNHFGDDKGNDIFDKLSSDNHEFGEKLGKGYKKQIIERFKDKLS